MKRPITFDLDGVIANFNAAAASVCKEVYPDVDFPDHPAKPTTWWWHESVPGLTEERDNHLWKVMNDTPEFWLRCTSLVTPEQVERINRLTETQGVAFITNRPARGANRNVIDQTCLWLEAQGFASPADLYVTQEKKGATAARLRARVHIDDNGPNVLDCLDHGVDAVLLCYRYNEEFIEDVAASGGVIVETLDQFLDIAEALGG